MFTRRAIDVFNPVTSGGAARGADMGEALVWGSEIELVVGSSAASGGAIIFASKAAMDADLAHVAGKAAWVVGDATVANNAIYRKTGISGSGSWVYAGPLPYQVISLAVTGTANALVAVSNVPVPTTDRAALLLLPTPLANTGPVTIAVNGAAALPVLDRNGAALTEGFFLSGGSAMLVRSGSAYRAFLDNDYAGAMATIVATLAELNTLYLGEKTTFPALDNAGNALISGALVSITGQPDAEDDGMYVWRDGAWQAIGVMPAAFFRTETIFVDATQAAAGEVDVPGGYVPGNIMVARNGAILKIGPSPGLGDLDDDADASDGVKLVFDPAYLAEKDFLFCQIQRPFNIATLDAADVPFAPPSGMTATQAQAAIAELHASKVPQTRTITTTGLLTGGAALSGNLTLTVPKASEAEAIAGTNDTKAVTPLGLAAAITAAGAAPAMVLIDSDVVASAAATIDIPLTGSYRRFRLVVDQIEPVTADQGLLARLSFDAGATYPAGTNYRQAGRYENSNGAAGSWSNGGSSAFFIGRNQPATSGWNAGLEIDITTPTGGRYASVSWRFDAYETGPHVSDVRASGRCIAASTAPSHVRLIYNSGNIAAGARWQLYGLRD